MYIIGLAGKRGQSGEKEGFESGSVKKFTDYTEKVPKSRNNK
jgi:hypothetical protein